MQQEQIDKLLGKQVWFDRKDVTRLLKESSIDAREQEGLLSDEELSLLQRVEQDMQMFSEGRHPYDSNKMPNQKWRRATIADVERRFKSLMPRFAALTTKLMNASRQ